MIKKVFFYGLLLALLSLSLKLLEYKLVIMDQSLELYGGVIALIFTVLGIIFANKIITKKEILVEKQVYVQHAPVTVAPVPAAPVDLEAKSPTIDTLGISKREYEILEYMAQGCSNQEIADKAFVSVSTVKTHISNLFLKLDVQRRTQAIKKAQELNLLS